METLPLRDIATEGADLGDLLGFNGTGWAPQAPPAMSDGKFRGVWAPDQLAAVIDFASAIPADFTLAHTGAGTDPVFSSVSSSGLGGAPAIYTGAVRLAANNIGASHSSSMALQLSDLGVANITRVKTWVGFQAGSGSINKAARIYKNGALQSDMAGPFSFTQVEVAASAADTIQWKGTGVYGVDAPSSAEAYVTGIEVYATTDPYLIGDFVSYQGKLWRSLLDANGATPGSAGWEEVPIGAPTLNPQTGTAYTLATSDPSKLVTCSNASAVTVTVPANATAGILVGSKIQVANLGAGAVTVSPAAGVTIQKESSASYTLAQYQGGTLTKVATNTWLWQPTSGASGSTDPTTTKGDIAVRGASALSRLAVGADGQVLAADSTQTLGVKWVATLTDLTTTKGDLLARSTSALGRLAVGTDGQVLTADAASTLGVKWATPSGGSGGGGDTSWSTPTFQNSWTGWSSDTVFAPGGYRKDSTGVVRLRGLIVGGTAPSVAFTLPAGYRPSKAGIYAITANGALGRIVIYADGRVEIQAGSSAYTSLEGITFLAE